MKLKYKVGDIVIGIKNDPKFPKINIIGRIGRIMKVNEKNYDKLYYNIKFNDETKAQYTYRECEIKLYLIKAKLKKLLEE